MFGYQKDLKVSSVMQKKAKKVLSGTNSEKTD